MSSVGDIEDCVVRSDPLPSERGSARARVLPRALRASRKRAAARACGDEAEVERPVAESFIPGTQPVYVKTWGCSHNNSDGEYMAGILAASGYPITSDPLSADLWLLNSCTVKGPSEDGLVNSIVKGRELGKRVVVAGCVPQGQRNHPAIAGLSVVGVQQIDRIVEVVEETLKGNTVRLFKQRRANGRKLGGAPLNLPKVRRNPLVEIIPINTGCLNQCAYCKTKHARGDLGSYTPTEIIERARQAFTEGVVELWLTSEDLGAYGRDIGTTLPELLRGVVREVPRGRMVRLGMTNPPYILEHLEEMAGIFSHPSVYSFLHLPVQCGSDAVLADMKREYSIADFRRVVDTLKQRVPGITIATDIICGFPTETEEDFEETLQLVEEYKFPSLFINQFYPRTGTPAAHMRRIPTQQVKERTRRLSKLFHSYHPYQHKVGQEQVVLATEESHDGVHLVTHNKFYDQVLVPKAPELMGKMFSVKITSAGKHYLIGELSSPPPPPSSLPSLPSFPPRTCGASGPTSRTLTLLLCLSLGMLIVCVAVRLQYLYIAM